MPDTVWQEFYCAECAHYLSVSLDDAYTGEIAVICPCGHRHQRYVKNGRVVEVGRGSSGAFEIELLKSQRYKQPRSRVHQASLAASKAVEIREQRAERTELLHKKKGIGRLQRDAQVEDEETLLKDLDEKTAIASGREFLDELWDEKFGGR